MLVPLRLAAPLVFVAALAALAASVPVAVGATPLTDARDAVDEIAVDLIAAETRVRELEAEITAIAQQVTDAESRAAQVRADATARAIEIYRGGGENDLITVFSGADPLEAVRRVEFVDYANADANAVFDRLSVAMEDLSTRRSELAATRDTQSAIVEDLTDQQADLEDDLARVQAEWRAEQERRSAETTPSPQTTRAAAPEPSGTSPTPDPSTAEPTPDTSPAETSPPATEAPSTEPSSTESTPPTTAAPAPPPAPSGQHPHHDDPFLVCTRTRESSGDYTAENPNGLYSGAYQFHQDTWNVTASHANRPELIGVWPASASVWDQDDMAWTLYQWQGKAPWLNLC